MRASSPAAVVATFPIAVIMLFTVAVFVCIRDFIWPAIPAAR